MFYPFESIFNTTITNKIGSILIKPSQFNLYHKQWIQNVLYF